MARPYTNPQHILFSDLFLTDPANLGFAAIRAAFPEYTEELSTALYDALPNQATRDAYDAGRSAWQFSMDTQWPIFEGAWNTPRPLSARTHVSASELFEAIEVADFGALSAGQKAKVQIILALGDQIDVSEFSRAREWFVDAFSGTGTMSNLASLLPDRTQTYSQEVGLPPIYKGALDRIIRENP